MEPSQEGIDVRDMLRSPGWKILEAEIEDMIRADEERIESMDVEGRSPSDIGGDYLKHRRHADGLNDALRIARSYEKR